MLNSYKQCPLCHAEKFSPFPKNHLIQCVTCGLILDMNVWNDTANEEFEETWFGDTYLQKYSFWVRLFESWNNKRTWHRLVKFQRPGNQLLEIGVGSGATLNFMKNQGVTVKGCDLSKTICQQIENTFEISMHYGHVSTLPLATQYDVVIMNHVLEHVNDPVKLLQAVRIRMSPSGLLHLAVPNVASWEAKLSGWNSYEPYHLIYFTPTTLKRTLEQAGFNVEELTTHESFSGWFLAILRSVLQRNSHAIKPHSPTPARSTSMLEQVYRILMVVSGGVSFPVRYIQSKLGYGDEIIVIARPNENLTGQP